MESIKNFTNAADMLAAWDSGNFEFTVEAADGHKLTSGFGKVHRLQLDGLMYVGAYAGGSSTPIRYHPVKGEWRSPSGARRLVARWKSDQPLAVGDRVKIAYKYKTRLDGWGNIWVDDMDNYVGTTQTIRSIDTHAKECHFKDIRYGWPLAALERVEAKAAATEKPAPQAKAPQAKAPQAKAPQAKAPPAGPVLPSDEAGIEAMVKRMLGQPKSAPPAAPAPQKPPFHKGLLIQASEKYMGLGFNDRQ